MSATIKTSIPCTIGIKAIVAMSLVAAIGLLWTCSASAAPGIAAGSSHTMLIRADGSLWGWGDDSYSQLGDGTAITRGEPSRIGSGAEWVALATGLRHTVAIKADGTLWGWGDNTFGQVGCAGNSGGCTPTNLPQQIGTGTTWVAVSAGAFYSVALKADGTLWAWGDNSSGQLGSGNTTPYPWPHQVGSDSSWVAVAAGTSHNAAIRADGTLWTWGYNGSGQLGLGTEGSPANDKHVPTQVGSDTTWVSVAAGGSHTAAIKADGTLWAWGYNQSGQLGDGTLSTETSPVQVRNGKEIVEDFETGTLSRLPWTGTWTVVAGSHGTGSYRAKAPATANGGTSSLQVTQTCAAGTVSFWYWVSSEENHDYLKFWIDTSLQNQWSGLSAGWNLVTFPVTAGSHTFKWEYVKDGLNSAGFDTAWIDDVVISPSPTRWLAVAAGESHTVALMADGTLWSWGYNYYGQLGDGTVASRLLPTQVGSENKWIAVTAGGGHTAGIKVDGTVWTWGNNGTGQLGDGTQASRSVPTKVFWTGKEWVKVAMGQYHTAAVKSDGTLWTWGNNGTGQLGNNSYTNRLLPQKIGDRSWVSVGTGYVHTIGLKSDGSLWAWGQNSYGQLGDSSTMGKLTPVAVMPSSRWVSVAVGNFHTLAVRVDGTLWTWGRNDFGQLGIGTSGSPANDKSVPTQVGSDTNWVSVTAGANHSVGVKADGTTWTWGANGGSQLGDGTTTQRNVPVQILQAESFESGSLAVSPFAWSFPDVGSWFASADKSRSGSYAAKSPAITHSQTSSMQTTVSTPAGTISFWYWVDSEATYDGLKFSIDGIPQGFWHGTQQNWTQVAFPVTAGTHTVKWEYYKDGSISVGADTAWVDDIVITPQWASVAAGASHTVGIGPDGSLWGWGSNSWGQLGDGTTSAKSRPVRIGTDRKWVAVSAGNNHTVAVKADGTLWAWGRNDFGQLGAGSVSYSLTPLQIGTDTNWAGAVAGFNHTIALKADGKLYAWGDNQFGQLGDWTTTGRNIPTWIDAVTTWASVATGGAHSVATKSDGTLWGWGSNSHGELGDGTAAGKTIPTRIGDETDWDSVAAGFGHTLGVKTDGSLWAWGLNDKGQLGDEVPFDKVSPVQIGSDTWSAIAAGSRHSAGVKSDGTLWTWGENANGQLGDGSSGTTSNTPLQIGAMHTDNFETGNLSKLGWSTSGNGSWSVTSGSTHGGVYMAKAPAMADSQSAVLQVSLTVSLTGTISFWYAVSSEQNYDYLKFYIDGVQQAAWSGTVPWSQASFPVNAGVHTFKWEYAKDYIVSTGSDTAWIDDVVITSTAWVSVAAGDSHTLALRADGTLWSWGKNTAGQLGLGNTIQFTTPQQVGTDANWVAVTAAGTHSVALKSDGTIWAWGLNDSGQLGLGTTIPFTSPQKVGVETTWVGVVAGSQHTMAVKSNGTLWGWGNNENGQLGTGTVTQYTAPQQIGTDADWTMVFDTYNNHTVAVKRDGTLWAWGYNGYGQLGDGTFVQQAAPERVRGQLTISLSGYGAGTISGKGVTLACGAGSCSGSYEYGTPVTLTATANGSSSFVSWTGCPSASGNVCTIVTATPTFSVDAKFSDTSIPTGGISITAEYSDSGTKYTRSPTVKLALSAVDITALSKMQMKFSDDGSSWTSWEPYVATRHYTLNSDGPYVIRVQFKDVDSNVSEIYSDSVTLKRTGPTGTVSMVENYLKDGKKYVRDSEVLFSVSASDITGVALVRFSFDNQTWTSPETFATDWSCRLEPGEGNKTLYVQVQDNLGNWSNSFSDTVTYDPAAPSGTVVINNDVKFSTNSTVSLTLTCTDTTTGCSHMRFSNNGLAWGAMEPVATTKNGYPLLAGASAPLWTWGDNMYGGLGIGSADTSPHATPVQVGTDANWTDIDTSGGHTAAIKTDGSLWTWGRNQYGQLATGASDTDAHPGPVQLGSSGTIFEDFETATFGTLPWVSSGDGEWAVNGLFAYGGYYALAAPPLLDSQSAALQLTQNCATGTISFWYSVSSEANYDFLRFYIDDVLQGQWSGTVPWSEARFDVTAGTHVLKWEYSKDVSVSTGSDSAWIDDVSIPRPSVQGILAADDFETGDLSHLSWFGSWEAGGSSVHAGSFAAKAPALVDGESGYLELMHDSPVSSMVSFWYRVDSELNYDFLRFYIDGVEQGAWSGQVPWTQASFKVAPGPHSFVWEYAKDVIVSAGNDTAWIDDFAVTAIPDRWISVATGQSHTVAIKSDGSLWSWGDNSSGQLGDASFQNRFTPVQEFRKETDWVVVAAGDAHTVAIKSDGTLWGWGNNTSGQTGSAMPYTMYVPVQESTFDKSWVAVTATGNHTLALKSNGTLWAWGSNAFGQLATGDADANPHLGPTQIGSDTSWKSIATGNGHVLAIKTDNTLWAWGSNTLGQLGTGDVEPYYSPVQIPSTMPWSSVAAGATHTVATKTDGTLWSWGYNARGQLGNGAADTSPHSTPQQIGSEHFWASPGAAAETTFAKKVGDGMKTVYVQFRDNVGNWSTAVTDSIVLDRIRPTGSLSINGGAPYTGSRDVTLTVGCTDQTSGCADMCISNAAPVAGCPTSWAAYSATKPWTLTDLDGTKTVYVLFRDTAGNQTPATLPYADTIGLDQTGPTASVAIATSTPGFVASAAVTLNLSCGDSRSGCSQMQFSNSPGGPWSAAASFSGSTSWILTDPLYGGTPADGNKTVYARFIDGIGNTTSTSVSTTLDSTLPVGQLAFQGLTAYTTFAAVTLQLTCTDANCDKMQFSNDGITWLPEVPAPWAPTYGWTLPGGDGAKTVYARFRDRAGNWSASAQRSIILDTTAPTGALSINGGASFTRSTDVTLGISGSDTNGIAQMKFSNDNSAWGPLVSYATSGTWALSGGDGLKTVYASLLDSAGNPSTIPTITGAIRLDATPPTGTVQINGNAATTASRNVTLTLSCSDPGGGSGCAWMHISNTDGNDAYWGTLVAEPYVTSRAWTLSAGEGSKTVFVRYQDAIGNWMTTSIGSGAIQYDATAPGIPVFNGAVATASPTNLTLPTWAWISGGGGSGTYRYRLDNPDMTSGTTEVTATSYIPVEALAAGNHTLYVQEKDLAGNWSGLASFTMLIDVTVPGTPVVAGATPTNNKTPRWDWTSGGGGNGTFRYGNTNDWSTGITTTATSYQPPGPGLGDGEHTLYVWERDDAGNWSSAGSCTIVVDTALPAAPQVSGTTPTNNTRPTWIWTIGGSGNGTFRYRLDSSTLDDGQATVTTQVTHTPAAPLSAGAHWLYLQERDDAGNWSSTASYAITVDLTPPASPLVAGPDITNNTAPTWTWTGDGTGNGQYRFKMDSIDFTTGTTQTATASHTPSPVLDEGVHTLYVQEQDAAGNWSPLGSFTINVDITAPSPPGITATTPTSNVRPTWTWTSGGGNGTYRYKLNSSDWDTAIQTTATSFTPETGVTDGTYTLYLWERDVAGNWSSSMSLAVVVDTAGPGAPTVAGASPTNNDTPSWTWTSGGNGGNGTYRYKLNSTDLATGATETTSPGYTSASTLQEGVYTLYVQERDAAGNWSASGSFSITIDQTPPTAPTVSGLTPTNTAAPTWSWSSGGNGGSGTYRYRLDNTDTSGGTTTTSLAYTASGLVEGFHTLYLQERDSAGNWSSLGSLIILIDLAQPTGTVTINSGAAATTSSSAILALACSDSGSGCSRMQLSGDGQDWLAEEGYTTGRAWTLSGDGSKTVHARFKDAAGNWSAVATATIVLDTAAPVTTATPPGGSYDTIKTVTLTCSDGTAGVGCAGTWYSTDGGTPNIPYTGPITVGENTTLKYYSRDSLGITESMSTASYSFIAGYTTITLELSQPTIVYDGSVTAWGRLENKTTNNADPTGKQVTISITAPNGAITTRTATIYDPLGLFMLENITGFTQKGVYTLRATFAGSSLLATAASQEKTLLVGASAGYAILVEGKISNQEGLSSHNKTANRIYQKLLARGFEDDNIYYFNYDLGQTGVDAIPSEAAIQSVVQTWAKARMNALPAPLYLIMVDHGSPNAFHINSETITPAELASWLETLEAGLSGDALKEKRIIVIGSCYSGTFIDPLSQAPAQDDGGRVIVTSAAPDEVSYKGPQEGDGVRSGEYFLEEFFTELERGRTIRESFMEATVKTRLYTQRGGGSANANAPYFDGAVQHPMLDDNGDGTGSNGLTDDPQQDGETVRTMVLGAGVAYAVNSADNPVDITEVTDTIYLNNGENSALLWAKVNDDTQVDSAVWMEIRKPSLVLGAGSGTEQANLDTTRIPLVRNVGANRWEKDPALAGAPFNENGTYEIFYFVRDVESLKLAPMQRSVVYRNKADNAVPAAFNLVRPNGTTENSVLVLEWEPSSDTDGVTYTVEIATTAGFGTVVHRQQEIRETFAIVPPDALVDLATYYWRATAVDRYGARTVSTQTFTFTTDNTNADVIVLRGTTVAAGSYDPVRAQLTVTGASGFTRVAVAAVDGSYYLNLGAAGSFTLTVSADGYATSTTPLTVTSQGRLTTVVQNVTLAAAPENNTITVTLAGTGSGTVNSVPSGIACPGACAASSATLGSSVTLSAFADGSSSTFAGWTGQCTPVDATSCVVSLTDDASVIATFTVAPLVVVEPVSYGTIQESFNLAPEGALIKTLAREFIEDPILGRDVALTLKGGFDAAYTSNAGWTAIRGSLTVITGSLTLEQVTVK